MKKLISNDVIFFTNELEFFCINFAVEIRFDNLSSSSSKILEYRPDILSTATSLTLGID